MFLEHFIKAFWATVMIFVVIVCVTGCADKPIPVHTDEVEIEAYWESE